MLLTRSVTRMSSVGRPSAAPISTSSGLRLLRSEPEKTLEGRMCCLRMGMGGGGWRRDDVRAISGGGR